jgi:hypothetical protein
MAKHLTTPKYGPFWLIDTMAVAALPKVTNPTSLQLTKLTVHDGHFEPTVGIL